MYLLSLPSFLKRVPSADGGCFRLPVCNIKFKKHPSAAYATATLFKKEGIGANLN